MEGDENVDLHMLYESLWGLAGIEDIENYQQYQNVQKIIK